MAGGGVNAYVTFIGCNKIPYLLALYSTNKDAIFFLNGNQIPYITATASMEVENGNLNVGLDAMRFTSTKELSYILLVDAPF